MRTKAYPLQLIRSTPHGYEFRQVLSLRTNVFRTMANKPIEVANADQLIPLPDGRYAQYSRKGKL